MAHDPGIRAVFRCDGSFQQGLGHIARCAMLSRSLPDLRGTLLFSGDALAGEFLKGRGASYRRLPLCTTEEQDWATLISLCRELGATYVFVDRKDNSQNYIGALKDAGLFVVDIEDRGEGRELADMLIDPHIWPGTAESEYAGSGFCGFGPEWVLLDPVFARLRARRAPRPPQAEAGVAVACGGSDPAGHTSRVLEELGQRPEKFRVTTVLGVGNANPVCPRHPSRTVRAVSSLARVLARSGLAVVSGGITMFESLCLGVPTIVVPQNKEQHRNAFKLAKKKALLLTDLSAGHEPDQSLSRALDLALTDMQTRESLSIRGSSLVDGLGTERLGMALGLGGKTAKKQFLSDPAIS